MSAVMQVDSGNVVIDLSPQQKIVHSFSPVLSGPGNEVFTSPSGDLYVMGIILSNKGVMGLAALYQAVSSTELSVTFGVGGPRFLGTTALTYGFDGPVIAAVLYFEHYFQNNPSVPFFQSLAN